MSGSGGYTLAELVVVILVMTVITILSYAKLRPALDQGRVNSAASVMAADLQYAQLMAARQRKPVVVIVTSATESYVIRDRASATTVFRTRYMGASTDFTLDEFTGSPGTTLPIFPTGVTSATTTFTLGYKGYRRLVKFTKAGQVRVIKY